MAAAEHPMLDHRPNVLLDSSSMAGGGHWLTGTGIMMAAYAVSLAFVEPLFNVVSPS